MATNAIVEIRTESMGLCRRQTAANRARASLVLCAELGISPTFTV